MNKNITITIKTDQYKQLCEVAKLEDRGISSMVRVILAKHLSANHSKSIATQAKDSNDGQAVI